MQNRVNNKISHRGIITKELNKDVHLDCQIKKELAQPLSNSVGNSVLSLVEEQDTVGCFVAYQGTRLDPKKIAGHVLE